MNEKKPSSGGRTKNRQPGAAGSSTIWARRQTKPGVNWEVNCSFAKD
jgi:hypothetical protein